MSRHCRKTSLGLLLAAVAVVASVVMPVNGTVPVAAGSPSGSTAAWRSIDPPENGDVAGAQWIEIDVPVPSSSDRRIVAAIFRPEGEGPFPIVVYLHGSSGLSTGMLRWAHRLSEAGYLVLAGCYSLTLPARNRIACPDGPASDRGVVALLEVARELPDARGDGLGVLGLSAGARMAFWTLGDPSIRAIVADSGDPGVVPLVDPATVGAAVLLLAFEQDVTVNRPALLRYDQKLRDLGKPIESRYFEGSGHVVTFSEGTREEATALTLDFFGRHLREARQAPSGTAMPVDPPTR